ncbi:MAG: efflux RND transporter periplasmic adaptor subunit [Zoogloeaceae bacterium]|jgi:HlyD family secretion protein|nr:efflux RND transporter periplasmic adaptor subunit [Zoogloeaceae bacterium]
MKTPSGKTLFVILLVAVAVGLSFWYFQDNARSPEQRYQFAELAHGTIRQSVSANGTLNPVTLVNVGTQVSGSVKALYVDFNDHVTQGQILAELDDALLAAQARQSEASLMSARATLDLAEANENRMRTLFAQEYVSAQDLDQAVQALKSAQAQVRLASAQAEKDKANLGYSIIRSPVSGVVVDRQVDEGQTVAASFQTPTLFKIAQDLSKMQIDSAFAEADVGNIKVGQPVRFTVDAFPDRDFPGKVLQVRLNPTTTSNVVTYNVVVSVDNPEQILLPGMTAYVTIVVAQRENALIVPNSALRFRPPAETNGQKAKSAPGGLLGGMRMGMSSSGNRQRVTESSAGGQGVVHALRDGALVPITLRLGITDNRNTEILEGELQAGDRVITGEANAVASDSGGGGGGMRFRPF